jgi:hypothetical protein
MKSLTLATLGLLTLAACRERDLGTGVNTLDREYAKPATETWKAAVKSVEAAGLKIEEDSADRLGGELVARRAQGDEVRITVKSLDERRSLVTVRVEPGDRDLAKLIHERIAENVGLGRAEPGLFGGDSLKGEYPADLAACFVTAQRVFDALGVEKVGEEKHANWMQIDGRLKGATPVRIRMEREDALTRVEFIAGTSKSDDHRAFVRRMKEEFESIRRPD